MIPALDYSRPLSLYIHIPFCYKKCDYCAFYSIEDRRDLDSYFNLLLKEVREVARVWNRPFYSIYIGGGNPGILGYERLALLLDATMEYGRAEEVTVELNPENVNEEISKLKGKATRISLGIQSLNEKTLKTLGRNASLKASINALEILSESSFDFNADIITAVPGESIEDTLEDIRRVAAYNPSHISFYCLTFEEGTPLLNRLHPVAEDEEVRFLKEGWNLLKELGYEHYEISAFSKEGKRSIHNELYWNLGQYIGLGATAESSLGYKEVVSARAAEDVLGFLNSSELYCTPLKREESEEEYLMLKLRVSDGIDKKEYMNRFGHSFGELYKDRIAMLDSAWFIDDEKHFALTEDGMLVLDHIILTLALAI